MFARQSAQRLMPTYDDCTRMQLRQALPAGVLYQQGHCITFQQDGGKPCHRCFRVERQVGGARLGDCQNGQHEVGGTRHGNRHNAFTRRAMRHQAVRQLVRAAIQGGVVPAAAVPDQRRRLRARRRMPLERRDTGLWLVVPGNRCGRSLDQRTPLVRRQNRHVIHQRIRVGRKVAGDVPQALCKQSHLAVHEIIGTAFENQLGVMAVMEFANGHAQGITSQAGEKLP